MTNNDFYKLNFLIILIDKTVTEQTAKWISE